MTDGSPDRASADDSADPKPSSYYFFKSTPVEVAQKFAPQRVEVHVENSVAADGTSVWNKGNTWEERDLSSWASETISSLLMSVKIPCAASDNLAFKSVETTKSHATIVFVRGKKRHGYEIGVLAKWSGMVGGKVVEGKVEFPDVEDDTGADEDFTANVSAVAADTEHECARMAVRKVLPALQSQLHQFDTLFRQK
uniref:Activator of Hsp90 ATPase AHSA1-like N-terminal domain-containing protein n=1 Tax=Spongospora subterranea TaxID=70186 RepID=A0A0H5QZ90_9EUKA|eukprot:CRZ07026.1 hypothetical protein [Spongospora subterranea]